MVQADLIGFVAGFFSMIAFIPQVYKTYKIKSAKGVSIQMFIIFTTSTFFWSMYGFLLNKPAVYITNIVMFFVSSIQIILKIKYDKADRLAQKTSK